MSLISALLWGSHLISLNTGREGSCSAQPVVWQHACDGFSSNRQTLLGVLESAKMMDKVIFWHTVLICMPHFAVLGPEDLEQSGSKKDSNFKGKRENRGIEQGKITDFPISLSSGSVYRPDRHTTQTGSQPHGFHCTHCSFLCRLFHFPDGAL